MTAFALACALILAQDQEPPRMVKRAELQSPGGEPTRLLYQAPQFRLDDPKFSPQHHWQFEYIVSGFGRRTGPPENFEIRFRVFSQIKGQQEDVAERVIRMLLRLWDYNVQRLQIDHSPQFFLRSVDVYLCLGGKAGGEHRFDEDYETGRAQKVNTIYIYDTPSFTDPLEMAREVAHEYGHATLPPIGIYSVAEDWANGSLGERLYFQWLYDDIRVGRLRPDDAMGASQEAIRGYLEKHAWPLRRRVGQSGPGLRTLAQKDAAGLDAYLGLALFAEQVLPPDVFRRSMKLSPSKEATEFAKAVVEAVEEPDTMEFRIPEEMKAGPIWLPVGKAQVTRGQVLSRAGGWARIRPANGEVRIRNRAG